MRRGRTLVFVLLILIVGLVVAYVGIRALRPLLTPAPPVPQDVQIFVSAQPIPQGGKITEDVLTTILIPADKVSTVEFTADEKNQLVGRVAKFPMDQGVVLTTAMITDSAAAIAIAGPQHAVDHTARHDGCVDSRQPSFPERVRHQRRGACQRDGVLPVRGCGFELPNPDAEQDGCAQCNRVSGGRPSHSNHHRRRGSRSPGPVGA